MKILHIVPSIDPNMGGVATGVASLFAALDEHLADSEIVTLDDPSSPVQYTKLPVVTMLGPSTGWWQYSSRLLPWLHENVERFDVIIVNGLWLYHGYATWKVFKKLKKRIPEKKTPLFFIMPHGMLDPYFQKAKERRIKAFRNLIYWNVIERRIINDADGLLFTCEIELLEARKTFLSYNPKAEYNIGYGITDIPAYKNEMLVAFKNICVGLNNQPYLLFLSRIHSKKGVDLLIDAYLELKSLEVLLPKLVIAGPGLETGFGSEIQRKATNSDACCDIFFTGMIVEDEKWGALYGCEAFILPSHQENFGIAVVEALACGKPVLISDQVNIWMEISGGGGGIVETDNLEGTKSMIKTWLKMSAEERKKMGDNAKFIYHNQFTMRKVGRKLTEVASNFI